MADIGNASAEPSGQARIRNVPIAMTPEGFWCCPAPVMFQKVTKHQSRQIRPRRRPSSQSKLTHQLRSKDVSEDHKCLASDKFCVRPTIVPERMPKLNSKIPQRKITVTFGQLETSNLKVVLSGKESTAVEMNVHRNIHAEHSSFFAEKLSRQSPVSSIDIGNCEDAEIYVETVGLMYCKEIRQRLVRQSVQHVLRIMKVAEALGFQMCVKSCLDYLEAVPWVGEEEEDVLSSICHLQNGSYGIAPILKRVFSDISNPHSNNTLARILDLVLRSNEDNGRREMKPLVLNLLKENNLCSIEPADICTETLYCCCQRCLESLLNLFREASEPGFADTSLEIKDGIRRQITLEADNLLWLLEILSDRHIADEFVHMWAGQEELAGLHPKLTTASRHLVSCITARLLVGIGRGDMLPSKDSRQMLLQVWLQPLINDYSWLRNACRSFDRKVVEEGIGQTILTLPLEDQQTILLSWLGNFLRAGDNCPNLHRAFEVWWRRTFIRPCLEQQRELRQSDSKLS